MRMPPVSLHPAQRRRSIPCSKITTDTLSTNLSIVMTAMTILMATMIVSITGLQVVMILERPLPTSHHRQRGPLFRPPITWWQSSTKEYHHRNNFMVNNNKNGGDVPSELDWSQSQDPYTILGISRSTATTEKELKRKYRQLAMKYHPDMTTTLTSSPQEKQAASDKFTKINQAYQTLLQQIQQKSSSSASSSSSSSSNPKWEPPHRRTRSYTTATSNNNNSNNDSGRSTDWRDYIPKADNEDMDRYDTNGDSFGQIFSDFLQGTASTVMGAAAARSSSSRNGGIFQDFIEFLEQNVDGYSRRYSSNENNGNSNNIDDDTELRLLLRMGSKQDIGNEMEESELVVQQLTNKLKKVSEEMAQVQNEMARSTNDDDDSVFGTNPKKPYRVRLEYQERYDELQSQLQIVERYLQRARYRLSQLQIRYKELLGMDATRRTTTTKTDDASSSSSSSSDTSNSYRPSSSSTNDVGPTAEGYQASFSSNRGRGSSRRRSTTTSTSSNQAPPSSPNSSTTTTTSESSFQQQQQQQQWDNARTRPTPIDDYDALVPPHRRTSTTTTTSNKSFAKKMEEETQRLREIKVDEAFDQLKRDLGL